MKPIANRLIVFAASAFALGSMAFGQSQMTAEIPFAFRTATGAVPAGTYEFDRLRSAGIAHAVVLRNMETHQSVLAGNPVFDVWRKAADAPVVDFVCGKDGCVLKAIRTSEGTAEYAAPHKAQNAAVAVISVPLRSLSAD